MSALEEIPNDPFDTLGLPGYLKKTPGHEKFTCLDVLPFWNANRVDLPERLLDMFTVMLPVNALVAVRFLYESISQLMLPLEIPVVLIGSTGFAPKSAKLLLTVSCADPPRVIVTADAVASTTPTPATLIKLCVAPLISAVPALQ